MKNKNIVIMLVFITAVALISSAQDMITAEQYFKQVSNVYSQIKDYQAQIAISIGKNRMAGKLIFKNPGLVRIDFSQPSEQVIVYNGTSLIVYVPAYRAVFTQEVTGSGAESAAMASGDGLRMMSRNYTITFEKSPNPVALSDTEQEQVVKLLLTRRTVSEGFRTIVLSINPETKLIRRMDGTTLSGDKCVYDFTGITLNIGIPSSRFIYDLPPSANVFNNFIYNSDN
jgi:outer membrane lipoprotein-sorting protein